MLSTTAENGIPSHTHTLLIAGDAVSEDSSITHCRAFPRGLPCGPPHSSLAVRGATAPERAWPSSDHMHTGKCR